MNPSNITRAEARQRSQHLHARHYDVTVDLTGRRPDGQALAEPTEQFVSTSTVSFESNGADDTINVIADEIIAAELDGKPLEVTDFDGYYVPFHAEAGEHTLSITAVCRFSHTGEGLHRFVDPADDRVYLYTQFESADARRMFANFEQPDQKATFTFHVIAPQEWEVISNGALESRTEAGDGFARFDFAETPRISSYITAIVAGDYDRVETEPYQGKESLVPMAILCRKSLTEYLDADKVFETTKRGFEVFEDNFGVAYPFGKYDQAFVPEFNAGAMENAGCVTHRDEYIFRSRVDAATMEGRDNTILHELCHMWFGDLVTMTWWDDLWLNESFAEFGSHFAQQKIAERYATGIDPWATFCNARKNWAYTADQMPTTHPIAADMVDLETVELNFDGITYAKGASALRLLVAFVGEDKFMEGIRAYFRKHQFGNTELKDLLTELESASGRDLSWFTGEWLEQAGVNTIAPDMTVADDGTFTSFSVVQSAPAQHPYLRTHRLGIGLYELVDNELRRVDRIETDITGERTDIAELVGKRRPALVLLNDGDLTYAKVRLDPESLRTVIEHMNELSDPLARAVCWAAAWDMCRDGELKATDYLALVARGLATEHDMEAFKAQLGYAQQALFSYVPAPERDAARDRLADGLLALLAQAEPGSDAQLNLVKNYAAVANSDEAAQKLRGWLDGRDVPAQLAVDADLRWTLVRNLCRMGAGDDALIDAELQRDSTITGHEWAALCRAARPDADAKAEAWRIVTEDPTTPNETARKVAMNFWQPEQDELLEPYVARYFELVEKMAAQEGIWRGRSSAISQTAMRLLFPRTIRTPELESQLDAWLQGKQFPDNVTRIVSEGRDALQRSLRAQQA